MYLVQQYEYGREMREVAWMSGERVRACAPLGAAHRRVGRCSWLADRRLWQQWYSSSTRSRRVRATDGGGGAGSGHADDARRVQLQTPETNPSQRHQQVAGKRERDSAFDYKECTCMAHYTLSWTREETLEHGPALDESLTTLNLFNGQRLLQTQNPGRGRRPV